LANGTAVSAGDLGGAAATAMAWRVLRGCAVVKKSQGEAKMERGWVRASAGVLKARFGLPWPRWAECRRRAAVSRATRRTVSEAGRPLCRSIQFISDPKPSLTTGFHGELSAKPKLQRASDLHDLCSPMYQLQLWFKYLVLIRNRNGAITPQTSAVSRSVLVT